MPGTSLLGGFLVVVTLAAWPRNLTAESPKEPSKSNMEGAKVSSAITINLGDYAKGDGTDETAAIQKAFDALVALKEGWKPHIDGYPHRAKKGVLFIPAPPKFYGISRTIKVNEKWNVLIQAETPVMAYYPYFQWLGPDKGTMFAFTDCMGIRVENLSMTGNGKKVTGVLIGYENTMGGCFKFSSFINLNIYRVAIGMKIGDFPNNGPDIAMNSFHDVTIDEFLEYGLMARSGNIADTTFMNLNLTGADGAKDGIRIDGGQLVVLNCGLGGGPTKTKGAAVAVYAGGINIIGCWSEWRGPFLYGHPAAPYPGTTRNDGATRFPTFLMGVTHYPGGETQLGEKPESENPVPLSIKWDRPTPLTLINNAFWGGVDLGAVSQSVIIDQGTTFLNRDGLRFTGEGIERYGRLLQLGTLHPKNRGVLQPYIVDRRNTPGEAPPSKGVWQKGDCIRNTDPDPAVPSKAWAGWICVEAGEPGKWTPYGALGK